jgi:prepilin-type N-terminal cleavage/methylation domain-containing protein
MYQNLKKRTEGFTIIEVLIVLAIAGLIMLIVFLAVPALQRNSRNNGRNSDGARISAAATECLANRNNVVAQCSGTNLVNVQNAAGARSQLTGALVAAEASANTTRAAVIFGSRCNPDGSQTAVAAGARDFAVIWRLEGTGTPPRCIGSQG